MKNIGIVVCGKRKQNMHRGEYMLENTRCLGINKKVIYISRPENQLNTLCTGSNFYVQVFLERVGFETTLQGG